MSNACNIRGMLLLSENSSINVVDVSSSFKKTDDDEFIFVIPSNGDAFQNVKIYTSSNTEVDVYLKNYNDKNDITHLGTNKYTIFPNTSVPYSEPFYNFIKPYCYLFIKSDVKLKYVNITYQQSFYSLKYKKSLENKVFGEYNTHYEFKNCDGLYSYDNRNNIHNPVIKKITYINDQV